MISPSHITSMADRVRRNGTEGISLGQDFERAILAGCRQSDDKELFADSVYLRMAFKLTPVMAAD